MPIPKLQQGTRPYDLARLAEASVLLRVGADAIDDLDGIADEGFLSYGDMPGGGLVRPTHPNAVAYDEPGELMTSVGVMADVCHSLRNHVVYADDNRHTSMRTVATHLGIGCGPISAPVLFGAPTFAFKGLKWPNDADGRRQEDLVACAQLVEESNTQPVISAFWRDVSERCMKVADGTRNSLYDEYPHTSDERATDYNMATGLLDSLASAFGNNRDDIAQQACIAMGTAMHELSRLRIHAARHQLEARDKSIGGVSR